MPCGGALTAQRRPEHKLRRHAAGMMPFDHVFLPAQRRPEHKLRRHVRISPWQYYATCTPTLNEGRSISSGDTRAAGSWLPKWLNALNEGRSISSGDTCGSARARTTPTPLNEGRSISSGDTRTVVSDAYVYTDAQRRPEHKLRRHARCWSTRRQHKLRRARRRCSTLNEGRSISSGDTGTCGPLLAIPPHAQRRPEHKLRRHLSPCMRLSVATGMARSTKAGA